jgi:formylmethanofuran dehydrogenase subunit B
VQDNRITQVTGACVVGHSRLLHSQSHAAAIRMNGQSASLQDALDEAARILVAAKNPLIYGLSSTSTEAQREAVALAEILRWEWRPAPLVK